MPRKQFRRRMGRKRPPVGKHLQGIRKLAGQSKLTLPERLASGFGQTAQLAKSVSMLAGLINSEVKYLDTALSTTIANAGASVATFTNIAEGDDTNQRNGRWILAKSIQGKFSFTINGSATATQVGWVLFMDKKASIGLSGTPYVDVLATADANALINRADSERFVILRRGIADLSINGARVVHDKFFVSLKGIHVKYNGTGATNYDQNNIFMAFVSNEATNTPSLQGNVRFDYYDN